MTDFFNKKNVGNDAKFMDEQSRRRYEALVRRANKILHKRAKNAQEYWILARLLMRSRLYVVDARKADAAGRLAIQLLRHGAEKLNEPNAIVSLAYCYYNGVGVPYDEERAKKMYREAIDSYDSFALREFAFAELAGEVICLSVCSISVEAQKDENGELIDYDFAVHYLSGEETEEQRYYRDNVDIGSSGDFLLAWAELVLLRGYPREDAELVARYWASTAFDWITERVAEGDPAAAVEMSYCLENGLGVEKNMERARQIRQFSLEAGVPDAFLLQGLDYEADEQIDEAFKCYRIAAKKNLPLGICKLAHLELQNGNRKKGMKLLMRAAESDDATALYFAALLLLEADADADDGLAMKCLRRSAELGCTPAQARLAAILKDALTPASPPEAWKEAANFLRAAAFGGDSCAKLEYACLLKKGEGVEKNEKLAARLFEEVETGDDLDAKELLALYKKEGLRCDLDPQGALELIKQAAKEDHYAQAALGMQYFYGDGVERDYRRAVQYFARSTLGGVAIGAVCLSRCCFEGIGVLRNDYLGEYLLRAAAEAGEASAAYRLGRMFEDGRNVPKNPKLAAIWFMNAAKGRNLAGLRRMASCYWEAFGVERDRLFALFLWELAAASGEEESYEEVERAKTAALIEDLFFDKSRDEKEFRRDLFVLNAMEESLRIRSQDGGGDGLPRADFISLYLECQEMFETQVLSHKDDAFEHALDLAKEEGKRPFEELVRLYDSASYGFYADDVERAFVMLSEKSENALPEPLDLGPDSSPEQTDSDSCELTEADLDALFNFDDAADWEDRAQDDTPSFSDLGEYGYRLNQKPLNVDWTQPSDERSDFVYCGDSASASDEDARDASERNSDFDSENDTDKDSDKDSDKDLRKDSDKDTDKDTDKDSDKDLRKDSDPSRGVEE